MLTDLPFACLAVVMGADHPLGRAIALHLSSLGFIVIASISSHAVLGGEGGATRCAD
jgi:NAD(P)-dependent dehydrogenase (short-subunit alcohol dehydrogenase family)